MLTSTSELLETARRNSYAIGAFNVYNLEGVKAVIDAAEALQSPAMLQLHSSNSWCSISGSILGFWE